VADVLDGEYANEHAVLGDRQRPEAALLEGAKTVLEKVSVRRNSDSPIRRRDQTFQSLATERGKAVAWSSVKRGETPRDSVARSVLPVSGGPTSRTPVGIVAPGFWNFWGASKNSLISVSSCTASSALVTSEKVTFGESLEICFALLLPKLMILLPSPRIESIKRMKNNTISWMGASLPITESQIPVDRGSVRKGVPALLRTAAMS
jgi:hypothetical protein